MRTVEQIVADIEAADQQRNATVRQRDLAKAELADELVAVVRAAEATKAADPLAGPITASAWIMDDDGAVWVVTGREPTTGLMLYRPTRVVEGDPTSRPGDGLRALGIKDAYGIAHRGPNIILAP